LKKTNRQPYHTKYNKRNEEPDVTTSLVKESPVYSPIKKVETVGNKMTTKTEINELQIL